MRFCVLSVITVILLSACNTMQGIGRDFESLGNGIDRAASDTKKKM